MERDDLVAMIFPASTKCLTVGVVHPNAFAAIPVEMKLRDLMISIILSTLNELSITASPHIGFRDLITFNDDSLTKTTLLFQNLLSFCFTRFFFTSLLYHRNLKLSIEERENYLK
jgi:hypothetical protein